jgi:small subunit ribosomal protein S4
MRKSGVTGEVLVQLLESRLDAFVLRAGFVNTIYAARQFVSHGHVHVDGRPVNLPGYQLKPGQIVTVKEKSRRMPLVQESLSNAHPPAYVTLDKDAFSAQLARLPQPDEAPILCDLQLVIEYYSR